MRRKVEPAAADVPVAQRHLDRHAPLGRPDVEDGPVALPGEALGDRDRRAHADARHRVEELPEALRVPVEGREEVLADLGLVLLATVVLYL